MIPEEKEEKREREEEGVSNEEERKERRVSIELFFQSQRIIFSSGAVERDSLGSIKGKEQQQS